MQLESIPKVLERLTGRRIPPGTWRRWILVGVKAPCGGRVRLGVVKLGGRIFTTEEYATEFLTGTNRRHVSTQGESTASPCTGAADYLDKEFGNE